MLLEHLKVTRGQIAAGEQRISELRQSIAKLNGDGCAWDTKFLSTLEYMQAMHVMHRDRLEYELATANPE